MRPDKTNARLRGRTAAATVGNRSAPSDESSAPGTGLTGVIVAGEVAARIGVRFLPPRTTANYRDASNAARAAS